MIKHSITNKITAKKNGKNNTGLKEAPKNSIELSTNPLEGVMDKTSTINSPTAQLVDDDEGEEIEGGIGAQGFRFGTKDFGKFSANEEIDPDQIGEENNGIRELQEEDITMEEVQLVRIKFMTEVAN